MSWLLFFVCLTALIAFVGGFATACIMAMAGREGDSVARYERERKALGGLMDDRW